MKLNNRFLSIAGIAAIGLTLSSASLALPKSEIDANSSAALSKFYSLNPVNKQLADKAVGVLVFARVTKAGAGVAGEFGEGELQVHGGTVDYYSISSASVGLTLGMAHHSEVILFMTQAALDKFIHSDGWSVGADSSFALVSKGATGQYDTVTLSKPVLGFAFHEKGLIGDLSLEGSKITKIKTVH